MTHAPDINTYIARMGERGASRTVVTEIVREYLGDVGIHLRDLTGAGASGQHLNEIHSDLMDRLIRRLFEFAEEDFFSKGGEAETDLCVIAVGGYARREMSIHSDVDLLFVYRDNITPHVSAVAQRVQTWLWDARLTVGGATRTIAETISLARNDATVQTAVLAPRYLTGSGVLFHEFTEALNTKLFSNPRKSLAGLTAAMRERHTRFGDSLYLLQPNLKEGAGGLRDYQTSYWAMQLVQPGARGREDFVYLGLLKEVVRLESASELSVEEEEIISKMTAAELKEFREANETVERMLTPKEQGL